jgi:DNA-binding CsgD family transcriptional regulator
MKLRDSIAFADGIVRALRTVRTRSELAMLVEAVARDMGFRYYALVHHDDLRQPRPDRVDLKDYPLAVVERLIAQCRYRRDPVIRACIFADGAFVWSDLDQIIKLDRRDRDSFQIGAREGLNDGITVPYARHGDCMGSCTFAGTKQPEQVHRYLGIAQMVGVFAFQAARRLIGHAPEISNPPRLHPRPRDCVVLAGRGLSNKEIARTLALTPRTVDGYLTEARRLFGAHDRTELLVSAVLAGEVGLHELRRRQPE